MSYTQKRESALANIETTLEGINGSGNYYLTAATVTRTLDDLNRIAESDLPFLLIVPLDSTPEARTSGDYEADCPVAILGAVAGDEDQEDSGSLCLRREKFFSDVQIAMLTDPHRGGYARDTVLRELVIDEAEDVPLALFWTVFGVIIDYSDNAP